MSSSMIAQKEPTKYDLEKASGERLPNGVLPLKELKPVHMEIIAKHLEGWKNVDIARVHDFTQSRVSILLKDPLAQEVIKSVLADSKNRFNSLRCRIVDVLAENLQEGAGSGNQFRAIDRYHKMHDILGDKDSDVTAEDVIQEIFKRADSLTITAEVNKT